MALPIQFAISKPGGADLADAHNPTTAAHEDTRPAVLTCILVFAKDSEPLLAILKKLAGDSAKPEVDATVIHKIELPTEYNDVWLHHNESAEYLGISKSTLYRHAEQGRIESRKLGNRLEYRRASLDKFKDQHVRPARRSLLVRGIIPSAPNSGK